MRIFVAIILSLFSMKSHSQDLRQLANADFAPNTEIEKSKETHDDWKPALSVGANISFGSSDKVVGQADGETVTFGGAIKGEYNYMKEKNEWRNSLEYTGATSKNPSLPEYVKTSDDLKFDTIYLHTLKSYTWLGPYAKASVQTSVFKGEDVRATANTYSITRQSGAIDTVTDTRLRLTDGFKPLTLKESAGFFAKIINKEHKKLESRLGLGAVQVKGNGQLAIQDNGATTEIEVSELKDFEQAGIEAGLLFTGDIDQKTKYSFALDILVPLVNDLAAGDDRSALDLTNWDAAFNIGSKVYDWMSVNYQFKLKKQPQQVDDTQIQHLVLLNFSYTVF